MIRQISESFKGNKGLWPGYVSDHLLPRIHGFELLMAPYAIAHLKLGLELKRLGYDFRSEERLGVYLTNTMEDPHPFSGAPLFMRWLAEETNIADKVKRKHPIMVVLGNPPYSGHSANTGEWIAGLLRGRDSLGREKITGSYFDVDGEPLGEKNPKWLNDDYVKFIRFAQWRIERTGYGILAFVTNHGYLDNPTFRGMRKSLMDSFDDLYFLDLHGNSKKKRKRRRERPTRTSSTSSREWPSGSSSNGKSGLAKRKIRAYSTPIFGESERQNINGWHPTIWNRHLGRRYLRTRLLTNSFHRMKV